MLQIAINKEFIKNQWVGMVISKNPHNLLEEYQEYYYFPNLDKNMVILFTLYHFLQDTKISPQEMEIIIPQVYTYHVLSKYLTQWKANGFQKTTGPLPFAKFFGVLYEILLPFTLKITFTKSHALLTEISEFKKVVYDEWTP